jgi:hypothetical protein
MCTCSTFYWTRQLFSTNCICPVAFGGRELCVPVLHSTGPDSYSTLLWLVPWYLKDESYVYLCCMQLYQTIIQHYFKWFHGIWRRDVMCTCITFCLTWQLFNTTLIFPVTFQGPELCVLLLHSAVPDRYLTLL